MNKLETKSIYEKVLKYGTGEKEYAATECTSVFLVQFLC